MDQPTWTDFLCDVIPGRVAKPRISGLTMVIDTGVPITSMRDLFELAAPHIDYWKLGFGSAAVCAPERIADKISLCQEYDIPAYPGGTAFEIAYVQKTWRPYLEALHGSGVRVVEISDGTIDLSQRQRREVIHTARDIGLQVLTEVGKKAAGSHPSVAEQLQQIHQDLNSGAAYVVVEARESGKDVGIYDSQGNVREGDIDALVKGIEPLANRLIWEAPLKEQQVYHLRRFGHKVNLGNVRPSEVISLECLRRGLRSDTMADVIPRTQRPATADDTKQSMANPDTNKASPTLWVDGQQPGKSPGERRGRN